MSDKQTATPKLRWFHLTPGRLLVLLLAVEAVLLLSERFRWFPFNEYKGWTVLIALAAVGVFLLFMLIWFVFALLFRRRFQFSIQSLLVLTIAVALPFSWLAVELKWAKEQKETVEAITKDGGDVQYDDEQDKSACPPALRWMREQLGHDFFSNVDGVHLNDTKVTDAGLEHIKGLAQLQTLNLSNTSVTDAGLEHLRGLTQLQELDLSNTYVTDAGLEHLRGLTQLQNLNFYRSRVTDARLEHLKGMTQLQWLDINSINVTDAGLEHFKCLTQLRRLDLTDSKVTDAGLDHIKDLTQLYTLILDGSKVTDTGLEHLKNLTQLQGLDLSNTTVTDAGLEHLKGLTQLQRLFLSDTKVTAAGVAKLQKALPKLQIQR